MDHEEESEVNATPDMYFFKSCKRFFPRVHQQLNTRKNLYQHRGYQQRFYYRITIYYSKSFHHGYVLVSAKYAVEMIEKMDPDENTEGKPRQKMYFLHTARQMNILRLSC